MEKQKYIKSVLGEKEYQSLVDKFINIGISPIRCIKELLQNADDCDYETDSSYICVKYDDGKFIITYNETGFKREDLMAITSLSSSTKDKASHLIGKKGVGFKSVFGVASEVEIHSNAFDFKLSKDTPTIPERLKPLESRQDGTTIIFKASSDDVAVKIRDYLSTNNLIKDILCLRNLKIFNIFGSIVEASDTGNIREIVSERDGSYKFWRYQESFIVDKSGEGFDAHDKTQKINCYYQVSSVMPGSRNVENPIDSYLYCGLPTETKCCNGISVDAEFNLDLPREGLVADAWNEYLLEKSVDVMVSFLHRISENLSSNLKSKVFDLLGMEFNNTTKDVDIKLFSDYHIRVEDYWLSKLKETEFLPTYESNVYIAPSTPGCVRYPAVAHMLLEDGKKFLTSSRLIMNGPVTDMDSIYRKLGIIAQDEEKVLDEISPYVEEYITKSNGAKVRTKNNFADRLYSYLSNLDTETIKLKDRIWNLPIIPILDFDSNESTRFICKNEGDVYLYRDDVIDSERDISSFMFLDESIMTDKTFFNVFDVYPRILSEYSINKNYSDRLVERIESTNCEDDEERKELYRYLLNEYTIGKITKHNCLNLISVKYREGKIPLKNKNGDIVTHAVFLYYENTSDGPFKGMLMNEFAVSTECYDFACYATQCDDLYMIVEDSKSECVLDYLENNPDFMLTLDDLDDLKSSYFGNVLKICPFVMELYSNDYVDDDMLDASGLKVIIDTIAPDLFNDYKFPSERVNEQSLNSYMDKEYPTYGKIVDEVKECKVKMLECGTDRFPLDYKEVRQNIMERYSPIKGKCFCQRCGAIKPDSFIEVVEIEEEPSMLAIPMNLALCLECAKTYQALRHISSWIDLFVKQLETASHGGNEPIVISFGKNQQQYTYKFKQTHLAEIQYILKHDKG
ncbi:MAG: hypothetical protein LUC17_02995, partial [Oscillospiraceae bacterium]|nr:hypothetical protein [Oscillospiraceae bacterium]